MFLLKVICNITYEVKINGELPKEPVIYISNHQSAWETIAFPSILPPFMWILKRELFFIPFFGWCLMALGHIGIDRKSGSKAIKEINDQGKELLERGYNVVVFPEGTRRPPGKLGQFNPGGVGLAIKCGVPIVPVVHNAGNLWGRKAFGKKAGKISVVIEKPIATANILPSDRRKTSDRVREIIANELDQIGK